MKHDTVHTLIVGAGPAGIAAGIFALRADPERRVHILERNSQPGRKFLLSGSGQCNVTHGGPIGDFSTHYGDVKKARFVQPALTAFDNGAVMQFFEELGVPLWEREDGKIFPRSLRSRDLLNAMLRDFSQRGGRIETGISVGNVFRTKFEFRIEGESEPDRTNATWFSETLILATGGASYPATGSRGDGFRFAESLGHRIVSPRPALTPIFVRDAAFLDLAGISVRQTKIELQRRQKRIATNVGDVLFTHHGLSGPGILDLSRTIEPGDTIRVALTPDSARVQELLTGKKTLRHALEPLAIPERLLLRLLETLGIRPETPASEVVREQRKRLQESVAGLPFIVEKLGGWKESMVTAGGVALDEVDRKTMRSRRVPGLSLAGEILDIDGDTGGYNIQFALSSGRMAGEKAGN